MSRRRIVVLASAVALLSLGLIAALVVVAVTQTDYGRERVRSYLVGQVKGKIRGTMHIGRIGGSFLTGITIDSIEIRDDQDSLFLATGRISVRYDPRDLLDKRILIEHLEIEHPVMRIEEYPDGNQNWRRIFRRGETPPGPPRPKGAFGEWVLVDSAVVRDAAFTFIMPWRLPDTLSRRQRDSSLAYNLGRTDAEIRRRGDRYSRTLRWTNAQASASHIRIAHPDSAGQLFVIAHGNVDEFDPPFAFRNVRGTVRVVKDSLWLDLPHFDLPGSTGSATGKVVWGSGLPIRYAIDVVGDSVSMADIAWVYPTLPRTGGGRMKLRIENQRDNLRVLDYAIRDMEVRTTRSRLLGDMTFGVGGGVLIVKDVDIEAAPLDFDLIHVFNGGSLSRDWRGTLTGTVKGRGGPLTRFVVDDARLTFRDAHVPGAVARATGRGTLDIFEPDFTVFHGFDVDVETLDLRTIRYLFPDFPELNGTVAGTGTLDSLWLDVRFSNAELSHMDGPGEPSRVAGRGRITYGEPFIAYDLDLVAGPLSFTTLARSYPVIPIRGGYSGTIVARGTLEDMDLDARLTGEGGTMAVQGNFDFYEPLYAARATGSVAELDLRTLLAREDLQRTRLNARVDAGIAGDSLPALLGRVAVTLDRSVVGDILVDPSSARLRFEGGRLVVDTLMLATSAAAVRATGALGLTRAVSDSLSFRVIVDSLGGLRPWIAQGAGDSLAGYLETEGVARGAIDSLDVRGRLEGHDLFLRGDRAKLLTGGYEMVDLLAVPRGRAEVALDTLVVAGLGITRASAELGFDGPGSTRFAAAVLAINDARLAAGGRVERSGSATAVRLDSAALAVGGGTYRLRAPARLTSDSAGVSVDALELRHDERGWLAVRGSLPNAGAVDLAIAADSLSLADVALLAQLPDTAAGLARLDWRITGTRLAPLMTIGAALSDARFAGARLERLAFQGSYNDRRLVADLGLYRGGRRALVATGSLPVDLALVAGRERLLGDSLRGNIRTDSVDLAVIETFSSQLQRATGRLEANVNVAGTWRQPILNGHLGIESGAVTLANVGIRLQRLTADIALTGDSLHVRRLSMASGEERARSDTAALTGWVSFADFADPRFDLRFSARNFEVIDRPRVGQLDISTGSSQPLNLSGSKSAGRLTGSVIVDQGTIEIPELIEKNLIDLSDPELGDVVDTSLYANRRLLDEAPSEFVQNLTLDNVRLVIGEDVWLRSSEAAIKLAGQLDVTRGRAERNGDAAQLALAGTLTTERGTYTLNLGLVRPNFTVERGTLRFFGDPDLNPTLDISALHVVRRAGQTNRPDVRIRVTIAGTLAQPELRLSSADDPPIPESDLFSYLVTGEPAFALGGTGEQYTGTAASLGLRLASSWFTSRFQGPFDYVQIQTAGVSGAEARGFLRDPTTSAGSIFSNARIGVGWQVADRTFVSASTGLCQFGPDAQQESFSREFLGNLGGRVEHRFNHGFSAELSLEPATTSTMCGKQSSTILQQTPHQVGFDLFRSWSF